jgi:hypothetical protein
MRFITQFELCTLFEIKNYKSLREKGSAEWLGLDIAKAFGWEERGETTLAKNSPVIHKHSLEIEAFPMDKWIEFKNILKDHVATGNPNITKVWLSLLELESYSKNESSGQ